MQAEEVREPPSAPHTAPPRPERPGPHLPPQRPHAAAEPGGTRVPRAGAEQSGGGTDSPPLALLCLPSPHTSSDGRRPARWDRGGRDCGLCLFVYVLIYLSSCTCDYFSYFGIRGYGCGGVCGAHELGPLPAPQGDAPRILPGAAPQRRGCALFPDPTAQIRMRDRNHLFLIKTKQHGTKKPGPLKGRGFRK